MKGKVFCSGKRNSGDKKDLESHGISGRMDETGKSEDSGARIFYGCTGVKMNNRGSENHIGVPAGAYRGGVY